MKKSNLRILLALSVLIVGIPAARWCIEKKTVQEASAASPQKKDYYYCAMHPWFHQDHPGNCGICGMTLIKRQGGAPGGAPNATGGGTGIPDSLKGLAGVDLSPFKQQLIGLRTATVENKPVVRVIRTVGRFAGGSDDFSAAVGDFAAKGSAPGGNARYWVADIYALDIPYVKAGQRAWVSSLNGTGTRAEGRVAQIYPYDGTQSRVRRVNITLLQPATPELFANVEIEAASQPLLSVPLEAVMSTGLHHYVFVKSSPEAFEPREVTVGFQGDEDCQVTSGLNLGQTVVVGANFLVDADSKLAANFAAMESQSK